MIGSDVWIGLRATILSGVSVGHGAVLGAGVVVSRWVPPYAVVVGNPAEIVGYRFDGDTRRCLLALGWWEWADQEIGALKNEFTADVASFLERAEQLHRARVEGDLVSRLRAASVEQLTPDRRQAPDRRARKQGSQGFVAGLANRAGPQPSPIASGPLRRPSKRVFLKNAGGNADEDVMTTVLRPPTFRCSTHIPRRSRLGACVAVLAGLLTLLVPAASDASLSTIGSPLSVTATLNTAEDLGYPGTYTPVPPSPEAPNGVFHTFHYGADTAIWNFSNSGGAVAVPATGQAKKIELEGCAQKAANGPLPLVTIHFQDLSPLPGGGAKVNLTSQGFALPICGENGAGASTITSFLPINLCVSAGDYVGFNDSGGYVPNVYRNGVPYQVLGAVAGSTLDAFIKDQGTGDGATLLPSVKSADDGFAVSRNEELMMRVTLATGADATHICPGGKAGLPPALAPIRVSPQTDGVNQARIVSVALFCRVNPCKGVATIVGSSGVTFGRAGFQLTPHTTSHLPIRVTPQTVSMIRRYHGVSATLKASVAGQTIAQKIGIRIF